MYFANVFTHLDELTNGVSAELIIVNDGVTLHGIRVSWTIKSKYSNCIYVSPRVDLNSCLLYTSPSPRDATLSRMPSSA